MIRRIFTLALTPALSPGEREKHSPRFGNADISRLPRFSFAKNPKAKTETATTKLSSDVGLTLPLPGGEGRGEGERFNSRFNFALIFALFFSLTPPLRVHAAPQNELVSNWLLAQTNIHTWAADFTQTRTLKSFTQPLVSTGQVWFAAPNRFRWELGNPAQTIAVRQPDEMLVIYPKLKRVEKYPLTGARAGPWRDALALLEAGFPRDRAQLDSRFTIQSMQTKNNVCELTLRPKSSAARQMMSQIKIAFDLGDSLLRATELQFADGSTMRNDFRNPKLNETLDEKLFSPSLDAGYKVVEPMK